MGLPASSLQMPRIRTFWAAALAVSAASSATSGKINATHLVISFHGRTVGCEIKNNCKSKGDYSDPRADQQRLGRGRLSFRLLALRLLAQAWRIRNRVVYAGGGKGAHAQGAALAHAAGSAFSAVARPC